MKIRIAHSPDSDDAFMFYGLSTGRVPSEGFELEHVLSDIETLNHRAQRGELELTAVSIHGYAYVTDKYALCACGASMGDNYGPMIVARQPGSLNDFRGKTIAVPGKLTTAYLALKLALGDDFTPVVYPFDEILAVTAAGKVDAGLIIHEGQLTYSKAGFHNVLDLGRWWKTKYGLPLPLGANALRRDLSPEMSSECCRLMRESIQYAFDHHEEALEYALQFARDMDASLADKFVGMYVNEHTVEADSQVRQAAQKLLDLGHQAGWIPQRVNVEFV